MREALLPWEEGPPSFHLHTPRTSDIVPHPQHHTPGGPMNQPPARRPMYPQPWQRWAWAALPAISATALTFIPFIVAWRRRVVGWRTLAVYTLLSGITITAAVTEVDIRQWGTFWREVIRYISWAYLITGVAHVALLDWPRKKHAGFKA